MTICIAANCAKSGAVVVASDRMLSAPFLTLEFDHPDAKIGPLGKTCVALTAGDALAASDILSSGPGIAGQLQSPMISHYAEHVRAKFVEARRRHSSEQLLEPRGLTFETFYQGGVINRLPPDLALMLDNAIQNHGLGVSVMLAGLDDTGSHIYAIEDPGTSACFDRLGYHAIGSGRRHAMLTLVTYGQHMSTGLNETAFNVYAAKRASEYAPGVGVATEMRVITRQGVSPLDENELNELAVLYDERARPKLDAVQQKIQRLGFEKGTEDDGARDSPPRAS